MGFRVPSFNLMCRVWSRAAVPAGPVITANLGASRVDYSCQLRGPGKTFFGQNNLGFWEEVVEVAFPPLTDVRDWFSFDGVVLTGADLVEVPIGSQVYYTIVAVYDVAKGFANEYRVGIAYKQPYCPVPMP